MKTKQAIAEALEGIDPQTCLFSMRSLEFETGGRITNAVRAAGYDESGSTVVSNLGAWNMSVAEFAKHILPLEDGKPLKDFTDSEIIAEMKRRNLSIN